MKIVRVHCNKRTFKTVRFKDGLNIVLATRTDTSEDKDSRNGVGKTTLFQIIDFCLGGSVRAGDGVGKLVGDDWIFRLDLEFDGLSVTASRALDDSSSVSLAGDLHALGLGPEGQPQRSLKVREWTNWLGARTFGLGAAETREEHEPTFRQLVPHFLRFRGDSYIDPFQTFRNQPAVQVQVENAFLLGLDSAMASDFQRLKDREKALGALGKLGLEELGEELGELESRFARESANLSRLQKSIQAFEVVPEYREVQTRANRATAEMQRLSNAILLTAREIDLYQERLTNEQESHSEEIESIFSEAGVVFGSGLKRTLSEVQEFHREVSENRRRYLEAEVRRLEGVQLARREEVDALERTRSRDLSLLQSGGALEDFGNLQQRAGALAASIEALAQRIDSIRHARRGKSALKAEQLELQERAEQDLRERYERMARFIDRFAQMFDDLYGEEGEFIIQVESSGYKFRTQLPRQGSTGTRKIGVFAYDLMLTEFWSRRGLGLGFLGHDSVIFDGVDERQVAGAVAIAQAASEETGFQYLLTVNSDVLSEVEFERVGVSISGNVVVHLTDETDEGSLLGVRF